MHLQQTKAGSRGSGGPQYYFHSIPDHVKEFLRNRGACPVVLQTPYGIAKSSFMAVDRNHKLKAGKPIPGRVGHDRIQQASGDQSIGEAIRHWYGIDEGRDFERIDVDATIHADKTSGESHFILIPTAVKLRDAKRTKGLEKVSAPLSFHRDHQSKLWRQQIDALRENSPADAAWATEQINRVVADHHEEDAKHILESDLLRTAGALSLLGMELSAYLGTGYDCRDSVFQFRGLPKYSCPVEVKNRSRGFSYQVTRYTQLPRAVVLCMNHDFVNPPDHVDIVELFTLAKYMKSNV